MLLADCEASTVLIAQDLERAKAFYTEKLGLKLSPGPEGIAMLEAGNGSKIVIYEKDAPVATNTVLGFSVTNLESLLAELKAKGVEQDMRALPEGADENGIMHHGTMKGAWINDSEGNIIALNDMGM